MITNTRKHIAKWVAFLMLFILYLASPQKAQAQFTEYEIKAALCFNFAKYIDWPERMFSKNGNKIILSIYGSDPFEEVIDKLMRGRSVKGKYYIEVRRATSLRDLKGSHIIFISRSERNNIGKVLNYIEGFSGTSVLTIGDNIEGFCQAGGILNLLDDYTFQINVVAANNAELLIDNKLINIAADIVSTIE